MIPLKWPKCPPLLKSCHVFLWNTPPFSNISLANILLRTDVIEVGFFARMVHSMLLVCTTVMLEMYFIRIFWLNYTFLLSADTLSVLIPFAVPFSPVSMESPGMFTSFLLIIWYDFPWRGLVSTTVPISSVVQYPTRISLLLITSFTKKYLMLIFWYYLNLISSHAESAACCCGCLGTWCFSPRCILESV